MALCADTVKKMIGQKGGGLGGDEGPLPFPDRRRLDEEDGGGIGGGGKRGRKPRGGGGGGGGPRRPPALAQCLRKHEAELSEACRDSLGADAAAHAAAHGLSKAPPIAP